MDLNLSHKSDDLLCRLHLIHERFGNLCYVTSWGYSGVVLLWHFHELKKTVGPFVDVPVLSVNTGLLHDETMAFAEQLTQAYDLRVTWLRARGVCPHDPPAEECCQWRKVAPLREGLQSFEAWVTAIRHDQATTRKDALVAEDDGYGKIRLAPMLEWTKKECWDFISDNNLLTNPLHEVYPSIGCRPCTNIPTSDNERSGRWQGQREECGIHKKG